jgi:hypothetical protein
MNPVSRQSNVTQQIIEPASAPARSKDHQCSFRIVQIHAWKRLGALEKGFSRYTRHAEKLLRNLDLCDPEKLDRCACGD